MLFRSTIYADDTNFACFAKTVEQLQKMANEDLQACSTWFRVNKLTLNLKKTHFLVFSHEQRNRRIEPVCITMGGGIVEQRTQTKFLGIILDQHLRWSAHVKQLLGKISHYFHLSSILRHYMPRKILSNIYRSLVLPHLQYCVILWGVSSQNICNLNRLLNGYRRNLLES